MTGTLNILPDGQTGLFILLRDAAGGAPDEFISKASLTRVSGIFQAGANQYDFTNKTILNLEFDSRQAVSIELQQVTNQSTWNGGTLSDLNTAIAGILLI